MSSPTSTLTMTEPLQVKGFRERLSTEQPSIPSGVMQAVLMHALQLRRSCREVFLLCDIQRHSVAEAAAILGISRDAAKRRLLLARRQMQRLLNVCVWDDEQASLLKPKLARDVQERFVSPSRARAHTSTLRFVRQVLEIVADVSCGEDHR